MVIVTNATWFTPSSSTSRINITISGQIANTSMNILVGSDYILDSIRTFISTAATTFLTTNYYNTNTDQIIAIDTHNVLFTLPKVSGTVPPPVTGVLASITISPGSVSVSIGNTTQLNTICKDTGGSVMTCPTLTWAWTSSDSAEVTVNSSGLVTGVAIGTAIITASYGTINAISVVTIGLQATYIYGCVSGVCTPNKGISPAGCPGTNCATSSGTGSDTCKDKDPLKIGCIFGIPVTYIAGLGAIAYMVMKKKT